MTDFDVSELVELAADLGEAGPKADKVASEKMTEIAAKLRDDARAAVPVDTGELRDSIHVRGGQGYRMVIADAEHSAYLEFGTSDTAPQPYMWPAARVADQRLMEALEDLGVDAIPRFR